MKVELIGIGRNKFNGTAVVKDLDGALREVKKHLMSRDVELVGSNTAGLFTVWAGIQQVGKLRILEVED